MTVKLMNDHPEFLTLSGSLAASTMIDLSPLPVGDITFQDLGTLDPKPDITPLESVRLMHMLTVAMIPGYSFRPRDFKGFAEEHGLMRHFRK